MQIDNFCGALSNSGFDFPFTYLLLNGCDPAGNQGVMFLTIECVA